MSPENLRPVTLTGEERKTLEGWAKKRTTSQSLALRARIVLSCLEEDSISAVAAKTGTSRATVSKWRARFLEEGIDGLSDKPRPGRPRKLTEEQIEQILTAALEQEPAEGRASWSTRSMAQHADTSQSTVSRVWRSFGLKPPMTRSREQSAKPVHGTSHQPRIPNPRPAGRSSP